MKRVDHRYRASPPFPKMIARAFICLFAIVAMLPWTGAVSCGDSAADIGEKYTFNTSFSSPQRLCFQLNSSTETQAVRVFVESVSAVSRHPVLVTVRQPMGVASWAVPHVESGFSYTSVERTLCPLLNIDDSGESSILVDLSTSYTSPLSVTLRAQFVTPYKLEINNPILLSAAPHGPAYLLFEYPLDITRVKVKFTSTDNATHICAIASLQTAYCPVVDLLDNPDHRGRYQTMRSTAAIYTRVNNTEPHFGFFYVVLTVFPNDGHGNSCVSAEQGMGNKLITLDSAANNFNPVSYSGEERVKTVTITVEPALSDSGYVIAIIVSTTVYVSFYVIALVWIVIFDWWRYDTHFMFKMLQKDPTQFAESTFSNPEIKTSSPRNISQDNSIQENQSDELLEAIRPDSSDDEPEDSKQVKGHDEVDVGTSVKSGFPQNQLELRPADELGHAGKMVKRPSLISVIFGSHWNTAIDEASPLNPTSPYRDSYSPSSRRRRRNISESHALSPTFLHASSSHTPPFKRHKSVSESQAVSSPPPATQHLSMGQNNMGSHITKMPESHDHLIVRKTVSSRENGTGANSTDLVDSGEPTVIVPNREVEMVVKDTDRRRPVLKKQNSSMAVVAKDVLPEVIVSSGLEESTLDNMEEDFAHDTCRFPVNILLSELGKFDDSSAIQKEYNSYSWYLLAVIMFYGVPAYQLVITSQRLLTTSGNEDLCYYNSLCAHPWEIYTGSSLSAFNNIFSNIGFFILGFLLILIAYRRRSVYRSFEKFNCQKPPEDRVGVPQHFGIYYAIGLAMMAEAFMSVAYHICPSSTNYQFDTTFMYILAILGLHKLLTNRCPDLNAGLHKIMLTMAFIIVTAVVGVLYDDSLIFWLIFFVVYTSFTFLFSVEFYYRWQLKPRWYPIKALFLMYKKDGLCPPKQIPKFIMVIVSITVNWMLALFLVVYRPLDFGTYFLFILLSNFIMYLAYYTITKIVYRERPSFRPLIFVILAITCWMTAIYFYTRAVTDWSLPPALSRDMNTNCTVLSFYDSHDMWHFVSAFALFFSFLVLMTLDDRQEDKPRNTLRAF